MINLEPTIGMELKTMNLQQAERKKMLGSSGKWLHNCENCGKFFKKTSDLTRHLVSHSGKRPYACCWPNCGRVYSYEKNLKRHERSVHSDERPYICEWQNCDKKFKRSDCLEKHSFIHIRKSRNTSKWCDNKFYYDLNDSGLVHNGQRQGCTKKNSEKDHTYFLKQNEESNYASEFYDHGFSKKAYLTAHITAVHKNECQDRNCQMLDTSRCEKISNSRFRILHKCHHENCGKVFDKASALTEHLNRHTGERPYNCEWPGCQYRVCRKRDLKRHLLIHTRQKNDFKVENARWLNKKVEKVRESEDVPDIKIENTSAANELQKASKRSLEYQFIDNVMIEEKKYLIVLVRIQRNK